MSKPALFKTVDTLSCSKSESEIQTTKEIFDEILIW